MVAGGGEERYGGGVVVAGAPALFNMKLSCCEYPGAHLPYHNHGAQVPHLNTVGNFVIILKVRRIKLLLMERFL